MKLGALASRYRVASPQAGPLLRRPWAHLAAVRALPDADFAGFPIIPGLLSMVFQYACSMARSCPQI